MRKNSDPEGCGAASASDSVGSSLGHLYRVVITDSDLGNGDLEREELDGIAELTVGNCKTEEQIIEIACEADGLLVQHAPITRKVIESLERCRAIGRYGSGIDTIDVEAATERGMFVLNVPDYCIEEVSDHACALILSCLRKVVLLNEQVRGGTWSIRAAMPIKRIRGMTLGLVGFGNTGRRVAEKLKGFGMRMIAYDPIVPTSAMDERDVSAFGFEELIGLSDIISLHAPLVEQTYHLIGEKQFRLMKKDAFLINTSRGKLLDEEALHDALKAGSIAGAALDVLAQEPIDPNNPLLKLDNVIFTPHAAYFSDESLELLQRRTARVVAQVLKGEYPDSIVNRTLLPG